MNHEIRIPTADGHLFARIWGDRATIGQGAVPVVLLHDSLGSVDLWRDFPQHLAYAVGGPVIAYDRLGFGRSDPHPTSLSRSFIQDEADGGLAALLDHLGIGAFHLLGHSVGGAMAVVAAGRFGTRCRTLITVAAQAFVEDQTLLGIRAAQQQFADPKHLDRLRRYHGAKAEWVLAAWTDTWLSDWFANWTLDQDLRRVQCPALIIHGQNDEYGSLVHPRQIAALIGDRARLEILPDCGHVPHREKMSDLIALIQGQLNG